MEHNLLTHVANALRSRRRQKRWMKVVSALACVVVFCTTYALILPAITLEGTSYCGIEEHTHDDTCYEQKLICQLSDEVHTHGDECYVQQQKLVCTLPEVEAHTHSAACKTVQRTLICTLEETAGHTHSDACKTTVRELICTEAESDTHAHDDSCYKNTEQLTCGLQESAGHTHSDSCYTESESITCGKEETAGHIHGESCYETQKELQCDLEEGAAHVHGESCYEKVLTCTKEEHEHTLACYSNPKADLETSDIWERTLPEDEELSGAWAEDVLAIAESQLGYTESSKNYQVDVETGDLKGYTRYGAWYGDPYGHWCAMFASFCIDYAGVEDFPLESGCQRWIETLSEYETVTGETVSFYHPAEEYTPVPGDLIFFDTDRSSTEDEDYADHVGLVVEVIEATETEPAQIKTIEGNSGDKVRYVTYELEDETILGYGQLPEKPLEEDALDGPVYHCGLEAHTHSDECYDADGQLTCTLEEHEHTVQCKAVAPETVYYCGQEDHTHTTVCTVDLSGLSDGDRAVVEHVIGLIDEMPSADEIDARIAEYEDAEDYDGEEAYLTQVFGQVKAAYAFYSRLTDDLKLLVPNSAKLAELEYIWSATPYAATNTIPVYQINSYYPDNSYDPQCYAAMLIHGGSFDSKVQQDWMLYFEFNYWDAIVVDSTGKITKYDTSTDDKSTLEAPTGGFVLIFTNDSTHDFYLSNLNIKVGDYVTISSDIANFDFVNYPGSYDESGTNTTGQYNGTPYCTITIGESAPTVDPTGANPVTTVASASTAEFVELNLYEYYGDASASAAGKSTVNSLWKTSSGYTGYPGFQWNGGAYAYIRYPGNSTSPVGTSLVDRNVVDNIDFGNSKITDYDFQAGDYGDKSASAQTVGFGNSDERGAINRVVYYPNLATWGLTNRPIGMSTLQDPNNGTIFSEVLERTLNSDGYPQLKSGTYNTGTGTGSLGYLFSESNYAKKINESSIDGLFQYDETTGAYYYNSRENHAQYNASTNTFTLYNQIITPNFILYPFGNFLPFNDITDGNTASLVGCVTVDGKNYGYDYTGGGADYITKIMNRLVLEGYDYYNYNYTTDEQLYNMLQEYRTNWQTHPYGGTYWSNMKTSTMINDFFNSPAAAGEAPNPSSGTIDFGSGTLKSVIDKMYNIDFDVEKDFFFGMDMKMNFYQPKDGMTGKDTNGDGRFDSRMEFYFTGDDDVWVYIDNILFLDLSGIHRHVGGKIDFVDGRVYYYYLNVGNGGDVGTAYRPYGATEGNYYTFAELLTASGIAEADLGKYLKKDDKGNYTTFLDYSTHSFKFYYMERGSGSSVCRLNFNFPLIQQNTIAVEKELEKELESDVEVLGDPDFTFQVVDKATGEPFFAKHDKVKKWAYSLYDENGNAIQSVRVVNKNPDGTIKTLEVYQGNILLLKEVDNELTHYNDDGTVISDPNPKLLTTDENGYFTLKAGQRAEFVGIAEHWGEYYVREILPDSLDEQYDKITITGETTKTTPEKVKIGETEFVGADSTVQNSNASNSFKFTNSIKEDLLGKLSISKTVKATYSGTTPTTAFEFKVTMDGEPLPMGTKYYNGTEAEGSEPNGIVTTEGIVAVEAEHTVTIPNILAGTEFEVTETTASAEGYDVTYSVNGAEQTDAASATGTITLDTTSGTATSATVTVGVKNTEIGTFVEIPIAKTMSCFGSTDRTYQFKIEQVANQNGTALDSAGHLDAITLEEPKSDYTKGTFKISYTSNDVPTNEAKTYYYKISEVEGTATVRYDTKYYIVQVDVTNTNDVMTAVVTNIWQVDGETTTPTAGTAMDDTTILFTNTILRNLTVSKTVTGTTNVDREFAFTLKLEAHQSNADLPAKLVGTKTDASGTKSDVSYPLTDGVATFTLKDGESVKFTNIPYRSKWTLTEKAADGYLTTYTITGNNPITEHAGNTAENQVANALNTTVAFTNAVTYSLPESGGAGTTSYTMAGLMLMLCSTAYLLCRYQKRRRGAV